MTVTATGTQVNPANADSTGIGSATFQAGPSTITIQGDGSLLVNGAPQGNINDANGIPNLTLPGGVTVKADQEIDGANGQLGQRFVIANGEYKITAAVRKPDPNSNGYLDMNFEELTNNAADNATGYQAAVPGQTKAFGIPDLLRLEPGDPSLTA